MGVCYLSERIDAFQALFLTSVLHLVNSSLPHIILLVVTILASSAGRVCWKLNSSFLNDNAYVAMVRQPIDNVDRLNIEDKQKWWDIFLSSVRSKTVEYTKQKITIENSARASQVRTTRTGHRFLRETGATKRPQHRYWGTTP